MNGQKKILAFQDDLPCCLVLYTMGLDVVNFQRSQPVGTFLINVILVDIFHLANPQTSF